MFENLINSKFYAISVEIVRLAYITVLFLLFSIPVITIGASFSASINTIRKSDYSVWPTFWDSFKRNFLQATIILIFSLFSVLFLYQTWNIIGALPAGNFLYIFLLILVIVYNLNAYLFASILKKSGITFFRQVFFFTIGTLYKTFFVPIIAAGLAFIFIIIGGVILFALSFSVSILIYLKIIKNDLETVEEIM